MQTPASTPSPADRAPPGRAVGPQARAGGDDASWTTRRLLKWMADAFAARSLDAPRLCAELLLGHVIGCDRLKLYTEADRPATALERTALRALVARALAHEPVQYLVGEAWFFSLGFSVDRRVLIPRPATETLVEHLLQHRRAVGGTQGGDGVTIADVCTGSGCIAIAVLKTLRGARAAACDVSAEALDVARANAVRHGVLERVDLLLGDLLQPLEGHPLGQQLDYLVANPPYIPDHEWNDPDPERGVGLNVKGFEPELALRGGADGLACVRPLIERGPRHLRPGGLLMIEIATSTAPAVLELARAQRELTSPRILEDHEGLARVLVAQRV